MTNCTVQEMKYEDGRHYIGEFKDGMMHGKGKMKYPEGSQYIGEFYSDVMGELAEAKSRDIEANYFPQVKPSLSVHYYAFQHDSTVFSDVLLIAFCNFEIKFYFKVFSIVVVKVVLFYEVINVVRFIKSVVLNNLYKVTVLIGKKNTAKIVTV